MIFLQALIPPGGLSESGDNYSMKRTTQSSDIDQMLADLESRTGWFFHIKSFAVII